MARAEKVEKVAGLRHRIEGSQALLLADYRGLNVSDASELRRALSEGGARFAVVKNTLMKRAAEEAGIEQLDALLDGPTAVAFVTGDPVGAAKKVVEAAKRLPLVLKGAYMEGKVLSAEEAQALATLESREAMLATFAGHAKGEMARAAAMLQALQGRFLALLDAYRQKLPVGEGAEAPAEAPVETDETAEPEGREVPDETPEEPEGREVPDETPEPEGRAEGEE